MLSEHDHRALGQQLDLFHIAEESPGFVYWHPKGLAIYQALEAFIRRHMRRAGYEEIKTPALLPKAHWERSGHWEKFGANMFALEKEALALKPMSCPGHVAVYNSRPRSWRDLPKRYCEFGSVHRNEASGSLLGLLRSKGFEQDDAHVLCLPEHVEAEVARFCAMLQHIYNALGFASVSVALSLRPAVRAGSDADWDWAENTLLAAAKQHGLDPILLPGEGAFYGPKLEFVLEDTMGRKWQCGTIQLDRVLPKRLGASYMDANNLPQVPVMIHHAVLGSMGRFIGIMLEHHKGQLPAWLAPVQVAVMPISTHQDAAAASFHQALLEADLHPALYNDSETLSRRLVDVFAQHVPFQAILGKREVADGCVLLQHGKEKHLLPYKEAVAWLQKACAAP